MHTLSSVTTLLAHSLAWALLHSLWQGLLISVTLFISLRALAGVSARVRYNLSYTAFSILFIWFAATCAGQYTQLSSAATYTATQATSTNDTHALSTAAIQVIASKQSYILQSYIPHISNYVPFIITIYALGLAFMLLRFIINIAGLRTLRGGLTSCDPQYDELLSYWQRRYSISRKVQLYLSAHVSVPMVMGAVKPVILLPLAMLTQLSAEQVEAVLLHELAHIKRHDYLLNMLQTIAETILFFNPFVWLISGIIRREREHCCDDIVIACAASPLPYAKALAILETNRIKDNSLALAATGSKNQLLNRIKRIMEMKKSTINYSRLTIVLVAIIAIVFSAAMFTFTPSFAQKAKDEQKKKTVYRSKTVTIDDNGKKTVVETDSPPTGKESKDEDVNINISVNDDDDKNTSAKVVVVKTSKNGADDKKIVKEFNIDTKSIEKAMAQVDFEEIGREMANATASALEAVDWKQISAEVHSALAEVNKELNNSKLHKEISIKVKKEMAEAQKEMAQAQKEMAHAQKEMEHARKEMKHTKAVENAGDEEGEAPTPPNTNNYEEMLNKMQNDGLLNRSTKFRVEKDGHDLLINGVKQSDNVYLKYKDYLKGDNISIKGNKGSLSINVTNED